MPKLKYNGNRFTLRWLPEWDRQLHAVARKYKNGKKKNEISWRDAEADGRLRGLPSKVSLKDLSHRFSYLIRPRNRKKQPWVRGDSHIHKRNLLRNTGRVRVSAWTPELDFLLLTIACSPDVPRRGKYIDWRSVIALPDCSQFPTKAPRALSNRRFRLVNMEKRSNETLAWNRKHHKQYLKYQAKRKHRIINEANTILYSQLDLR